MTRSSQTAIHAVPLTTRDVQWLAVVDVVIAALLDPTSSDHALEVNIEGVEQLYMLHYSSEEAFALRTRLRALIPDNSPVLFVPPQLPASFTTLHS